MDSQNDPAAYLASLLASTSPAHGRPVHASSPYVQPPIPINYPLSNVREQPPFSATPGSMNFNLPPGHNPNLLPLHSSAALAPLRNPYMGPLAQQYGAYPYLASSPGHYQAYQHQPRQQIASPGYVQEEPDDDVVPRVRSASQDIDDEEPEEKEKSGRNLRQFRKKRKQTPVLVFDDDSDDGDYKEAPRKSTKRTKYDYDSEGAIEAADVQSSSEEPPEPAADPKADSSESKPKPPRASTRRRRTSTKDSSAPSKDKSSDAKARSEKASALLNRKGKGRPIPKSVQECDEADLMMWQWKHGGRSWKDIRAEWVRIMGIVPGRSSLSVRLAKMEDNFIDSGAGNDLMILKYKEEVEAELEDLKWKKVAAKIKKETNVDMKPSIVRKRYLQLQENGWVVGAGTGEGDGEADGKGTEASETGEGGEDLKQPDGTDEVTEVEDEANV